jgi:O-antigen/teichoic acid export membrane protein
LSEASGRKDDAAKTAVLRYYFQATLVATAVMVLMIILTPLLTAWLHGNAEISNYIRIVLLNSILQPANLILFVVLQIGHKVARVAIIENIADVAQLAISTVLLLLGWGVMGILAGTLIVSLVTAPLYLYLYQCAARELKFPSLGEITKTLTRRDTGKYAVQGFWIAFDQNIGKNLYPNLFFVVLSATTSLQTVGIFRLAFRLAGMPLSVIMPSITRMTTVSIPRIAALNPSHLLSACKKLIFGSVGLALASGIAAAVVVPPLIPIVYGNAFAAATPLFLLLLLTNVMSATHVISVPLLRVFQRVWVLSITNVSGVAIALAAYFGLIRIMPAGFAMCLAIIIFHMNTLLLFAYLRFFLRRRDVCYHPA